MVPVNHTLLEAKSWLIEKHLSSWNHSLKDKDHIIQLITVSDYAAKHVELLKELVINSPWQKKPTRKYYFRSIERLSLSLSSTNYCQALRKFRNLHLLQLLLLESINLLTTEEVMTNWSDCADAIILHALEYCKQTLISRHGEPLDAQLKPVELITLAMGKLGGRELNYSSDIDLIFTYSAVGRTSGPEALDNQQFFSKLIQNFSQVLQNHTADGLVFRVDLRLRPHGDSGPLVYSFAAMETYYQEQGRDWERYAMVKARIIHPNLSEPNIWFNQTIIPFIYRRYVDFSIIESLRSMKAMIERELILNPDLNDIKRGKGGIREIEFIIQSVQLIRGGRLHQLRTSNALQSLATLKEEKLLSHCLALRQAYLFLRKLENALQSLNDQQTHSLPKDSFKQLQITNACGFLQWSDLLRRLQQYQRIVNNIFHSILGEAREYEDQKRVLTNQLSNLWQGNVEQSLAINLLSSLGYEKAEYCFQLLHNFRHSPRCKRLSQIARLRLDRFMVLLLNELLLFDKKDEILLQVIHLLENIVGRSAYLALLSENPNVFSELLYLFSQSAFITSMIVSHPFLLEVLLDENSEWQPLSRTQLKGLVEKKLSAISDSELKQELLRQFKLSYWLLAARAEIKGNSTVIRCGQFLADLAQVLVEQVFILASDQLIKRDSSIKSIQNRFGIIAYGKLGSRELNFSSDLDLVFLHTMRSDEEIITTRLTQKILHMLTTRTRSGILYAVDTRLRPSGSAGLLVSHVSAFVDYQKNQAWTWEHQALTKARILVGNTSLKKTFLQLKEDVLHFPRKVSFLKQEILTMRQKMQQNKNESFKHQIGGLIDLEFMLQFLILKSKYSELARYTHTLGQLRMLYSINLLHKDQFLLLKKAYNYFHHYLHYELLGLPIKIDESLLKQIAKLYKRIFN